MLTKLVRRQLVAFAAITTIALFIMGLNYVQIPQMLGVGRYSVDVQVTNSSGLYPKANVTYRGHEIGTVRSVKIGNLGGAVVTLQIDDGVKVPADSVAQVRSTSVIGEQYVNFVPPKGSSTSHVLKQGSVVPASQTSLPTPTNDVLTSVDNLVKTVPRDDLRTTVDELGKAFADSGESYAKLIESGSALQKAATENLPETLRLIDDLGPVLGTQQSLDASIRTYATSLDSLTGQLQSSDNNLRSILATGSPLAKETASFAQDLDTVTPSVLSDLASVGKVLETYIPGIEHILIVLPALIPAFNTATPSSRLNDKFGMANLYFKLGLDPPACTVGFTDANKQRAPSDLSAAPIPQDSYCKAGKTSQQVVRGARNDPCPNDPSRRSATAAGCGLIFDKAQVDRVNLLASDSATGSTVGQAGADLLAPDNGFFLLDSSHNSGISRSWQQLLLAPVTP